MWIGIPEFVEVHQVFEANKRTMQATIARDVRTSSPSPFRGPNFLRLEQSQSPGFSLIEPCQSKNQNDHAYVKKSFYFLILCLWLGLLLTRQEPAGLR